ncbi:hypothetical protein ACIPYQ_15170 [Streptomyces sp. NPDC090045]|uniref:hypothetical protein n=1 Tax=Streptomyces sp. NPDC090045 TaxID=3365927 RepID=UPI00381124E2
MIRTQQIAGEMATLDLVPDRLTHDASSLASFMVDSAVRPTTAAYTRQQLRRLLHDAVLGPAGRAWLQHVAMHGPVADTVLALADTGSDPRTTSTTPSGSPPTPISPVARIIDVYGPAQAAECLTPIRNTA